MRRQKSPTLPSGTTAQAAVSRRGFLRRAGITGAVAAGLVGIADVAGLSPAHASTKAPVRYKITGQTIRAMRPDEPANCCSTGGFFHCECNGCCPAGYCCYHVSGCCGSRHVCLLRPGSCSGSTGIVCCG
jgi:hypothetical protein